MTAATHVRLACFFAAAACLDALLTANVVFAQPTRSVSPRVSSILIRELSPSHIR